MSEIGYRFLMQCKYNYLKGITPSNLVYYNNADYLKLISIGREFLNIGQIEAFAFFMSESQYFVPLWTAHIILEYGSPNEDMKNECLATIIEYANHPTNKKIAIEEQSWLISNG